MTGDSSKLTQTISGQDESDDILTNDPIILYKCLVGFTYFLFFIDVVSRGVRLWRYSHHSDPYLLRTHLSWVSLGEDLGTVVFFLLIMYKGDSRIRRLSFFSLAYIVLCNLEQSAQVYEVVFVGVAAFCSIIFTIAALYVRKSLKRCDRFNNALSE